MLVDKARAGRSGFSYTAMRSNHVGQTLGAVLLLLAGLGV